MAETLTIRTASSTEVVKIAVPGPQGATGQGVPVGGSTGQVLRKVSGTDYDTEWAAAGSGSGSVTSVALASTDLTISGSPITDSGTITANIATNAVTLEKLQTISSEHLLGRHGSGNGGVQQIGLGTGLAMSGSNVRVATTGITAGTYTKLTIDETGRATVGATAVPSDIGAQFAFVTSGLNLTTNTTLSAGRTRRIELNNYSSPAAKITVTLPNTGNQDGDILVLVASTMADDIDIKDSPTGSVVATLTTSGQSYRFVRSGGTVGSWSIDRVYNHATEHASGGLDELALAASQITSGSFGNISFDGKIGSTAGLPLVTTTAGAVTTLALGTANQVLRVNSGASGVEFADPAASGVTGAAASASDVLGVSGANITGVDAGSADRLVMWDDSASKLTYASVSGMAFDGTTLRAAKVDVYTAGDTWNKPAGAKHCLCLLIGGGGGGGSGRRGVTGTTRGGGGGGAGGCIVQYFIRADELGTSETITVGAGGNGAANVADSTNGGAGSAGGDSSIGTKIVAKGGNGGGGGLLDSGALNGASATAGNYLFGAGAASSGVSNNSAGGGGGHTGIGSGVQPTAVVGMPSGGGGGSKLSGVNAAGSPSSGGNIGATNIGLTLAPSGDGITSHMNYCGTGGRGADPRSSSAGRNGGLYGGGGGGGGACTDGDGGTTAGGNGGQGIVVITTFF